MKRGQILTCEKYIFSREVENYLNINLSRIISCTISHDDYCKKK